MKNEELQDLKPVYIHEANYSSVKEISLTELTMVLLRRKAMIFSIFTIIVALGFSTMFLIPKKYTYSTSIEIGSQIINGAVEPFESPQTLLAKLKHSFIPQTLNDQRLSRPGDEKHHKVLVSVPKDSVIIVLGVEGTEDQDALLKELLQKISDKAVHDHERIYDAVKQNFIASTNQAKSELASLDPDKIEHAEKIQILKSKIESYGSQLANLRNTREISPPMKSIEATGISKKSIVMITVLTGLFLAVLTAFIAEFIAKIKETED